MSKLKIKGFEEHVNLPVVVELLDDETVEFTMKFKRLDRKQLEKIVREAQERAIEARDLESKKIVSDDEAEKARLGKAIEKLHASSNDVMINRIVGWNDFYDMEDNEVPFSKATLKQLLDHPAFLHGIEGAFWKATGERVKN